MVAKTLAMKIQTEFSPKCIPAQTLISAMQCNQYTKHSFARYTTYDTWFIVTYLRPCPKAYFLGSDDRSIVPSGKICLSGLKAMGSAYVFGSCKIPLP